MSTTTAPLTESFPHREAMNRPPVCSAHYHPPSPIPSNTTADVGKIPDTVVMIHLGDRLPLAVARSALLQPTVSSVMSYIAPHVQTPRFTTRDIPGFRGKFVYVVPQYWDELLPYIRELTIDPPLRNESVSKLWAMVLNFLLLAALQYFVLAPLGLILKKLF